MQPMMKYAGMMLYPDSHSSCSSSNSSSIITIMPNVFVHTPGREQWIDSYLLRLARFGSPVQATNSKQFTCIKKLYSAIHSLGY